MKTIQSLEEAQIKKYLESFNHDKRPYERYASFDYCFNYFQEKYHCGKIKEIAYPENIHHSCLQLGFYLASWGMYRGSSFLLQKSIKIYEPLMEYIASKECDVWDIDVHNYTEEGNVKKLIDCGDTIRKLLGKHGDKKKEATDTLITKIMLGVFGNVPAFDEYFKAGSSLGTFNKTALNKIFSFYEAHKETIIDEAARVKTFDYDSAEESTRLYTKAKIIDMIFFTKGLQEENAKKEETKTKIKINERSATMVV